MKYILTLFLYFILSFPLKADSLIVSDFPDSNYTWNESLEYSDTEFYTYYTLSTTYYDAGDTTIENKSYRKLMQKSVRKDYNVFSIPPFYELRSIVNSDSLFGCIYNKKAEKKVYIRLVYDTVDKKLFDFSYKLGDVVDLDFYRNYNSDSLYVVNIGNVVDPLGVSRKYFQFSYNLSDTLDPQMSGFMSCMIEGLGLGKGINAGIDIPFERYNYYFDCINFSPTIKFSINDYLSINTEPTISLAENCDTIRFEYMNTEFEKNSSIKIYPNPSKDQIQIDIKDLIQSVKIYDHNSRLILTKNDLKNNNIDVTELPQGLYYCMIFVKDKVLSGKFLKE